MWEFGQLDHGLTWWSEVLWAVHWSQLLTSPPAGDLGLGTLTSSPPWVPIPMSPCPNTQCPCVPRSQVRYL